MKKTIYTAVLFLIIGITASSCNKKETGTSTKTENPAKATIADALVVDTALIQNYGSFEFGQKIFFSKNGNITQLGCKMASKGTFRVSLWDFTTQNLIVAVPVTVIDTTVFTYNTISSIAVTANTRYLISINNTDGGINKPYYNYIKKSNISSSSIYPFSSGSVTYEGQYAKASQVSVFPVGLDGVFLFGGLPDLQFEYPQ